MKEEKKVSLDRLGWGAAVKALAEVRREMIRQGREADEVEELLVRLLEEREAER